MDRTHPRTAPSPPRKGSVVVTRPADRAGPLVQALEARGYDVLLAPSLGIVEPADPAPLREAAGRVGTFDWVAFTSAAGVTALAEAGVRPEALAPGTGPRVAVVGPSTWRAVVERFRRDPDLMPREDYSAEGLAEAFGALDDLDGAEVLLPLAEAALDLLPTRLTEMGARVERVTAYRSRPSHDAPAQDVRRAVGAGEVALLTFTSPSTAENFLEAMGREVLTVPAVAIGPTTAARASELGFEVVAVPDEHTVVGLVEEVTRVLGGPSGEVA